MLENFKIPTRKFPCAVRTFWETLSEADREILMSNLCDLSIGHKTLEKALQNVGVTLSDTAIARHRTGLCSCSRI
jgi:hypothetical protein